MLSWGSPASLVEQEAARAEELRLRAMRAALDAYNGDLPRPLIVRPGQQDDNIVINLCRLVVDKGVSFLFGSPVDMRVDTEAEESPDDALLEAFWAANHQDSLLTKLAINGGWSGHPLLSLRLAPGRPEPRLILLDPLNVAARWSVDDYEDVYRWTVTWHGIGPDGKALARRQRIERQDSGRAWLIVDEESRGDDNRWQEIGQEVWPHEWSPIHHCQNLPAPNEFWGRPDLTDDLVGVQTGLNFVLSNLGRIIRFHAHPKTWARGVNAQALDMSVDGITCIASESGELRNLEMQSDLGSSLEYYRRLSEAFHAMARVPEVATGRTEDLGALSGVALQIMYQPLLEKTATKQVQYGDLLREVSEHALELMGRAGAEVTVQWPEPLPSDDQAEAETLSLHEQLGVSKATILRKLGYDPEQEQEQSQSEREQAMSTEQAMGDRLLASFDRGQMMAGRGPAPGRGRE